MCTKETSVDTVPARIVELFSACDADSSGNIDRELLVRLLLTLSPSLKASHIEELLTDLGIPKSGCVSYESFVSSLFGHSISEDRQHCVQPEVETSQPYGEVFVHGSGDCDQLGLGDAHRERQKPFPVRALGSVRIVSISCGGLHTICMSMEGQLYSWGCGDDGALGRPSSEADSEPALVQLPAGISAKGVACGDSHSCMVDSAGQVWQWGSYKDTSGFIGIAVQNGQIVEKSFIPTKITGLDGILRVSCGASHAVVLSSRGAAFAWGSNQSGQLGLSGGSGCEFLEEEVSGVDACSLPLINREGSGVVAMWPDQSSPVHRVVAIRTQEGLELDATEMLAPEVQEHMIRGGSMLTCVSRTVSMEEKQSLLLPQEVHISSAGTCDDPIGNVFASSECTFLTTLHGQAYGCGLNCDGQVGMGIVTTVVLSMRIVKGLDNADWIGGGLHMSAALVAGRIFTWGRAEECGHGLRPGSPPVLTPRSVENLPPIRILRCGMSHTLACSGNGEVYTWGCGIMHQLGNRPRSCQDPSDARDEPDDELVPYLISAKRFLGREVLMADGGAQHSVELVRNDDKSQDDKPAVADSDEDENSPGWLGMDSSSIPPTTDNDCLDAGQEELLVVTTSDEFWRVQVEAIYRRRNQQKLKNVPKLLEKYKGREAILYAKVCKTYDLDPSKFYANPEAWIAEDADVKPDDEAPEAQPETLAALDRPPLFSGLLAAATDAHGSGLAASSTAGIFRFGAAANGDTMAHAPSNANSCSEEDTPRRTDGQEAKRKRPRIVKNSVFKKSPKERRKPH